MTARAARATRPAHGGRPELRLAAAVALSAAACSPAPPAAPVVVVPPPLPPAAIATASSSAAPPTKTRPSRGIAWLTSEPDARARARASGAPLLVYASAAWAASCAELDRDVWPDPRVVAASARFVPLRLDLTDTEGDAEGYAARYGIQGVPEVVVLSPDGRPLARASRLVTVAELLAVLARADD